MNSMPPRSNAALGYLVRGTLLMMGAKKAAAMSAVVLALFGACVLAPPASGQTVDADSVKTPAATPEDSGESGAESGWFALHGQTTFVDQGHDAFTSPYVGPNSLSPYVSGRETWDITLYAGARPWTGAEIWFNGEMDQGFGLNNTLGVAGFPSGEAYKVGAAIPYFRIPRFFFRQTVDLGGGPSKVDADLNQFAQTVTNDRLVFTLGKFGVTDVFDNNKYAHNPRGDFLNWSIIDAGTFDYAAEAWGYSVGGAVEWYEGRWTLRGGAFLLSNVPNSTYIDTRFDQFQMIAEIEERHVFFGEPGKVLVTGFLSRGRMARYSDAIAYAQADGGPPSLAPVRRYAGRPGLSVNFEQQISTDLGGFLRAGWANGAYESYEFSDIDETASGGLSLSGRRWGRLNDTIGLAGVVNAASSPLKAYLAAGGLGILVGDSRLPHPGTERILESYYDLSAFKGSDIALDYQWVTNPGYNQDRGPVSILAVRLHAQF
jgi:high affinity Mn2+ porin